MKDGYYLSTYVSCHKIGNLYHIIMNRHDQNISLWKKDGDNIELVHFWELERQSRIKHHDIPFYAQEQARQEVNKLLSTYNLSLDDMNAIWGSPYFVESTDYHNETDFSYHSLCHLFSSVLMDTDIFYHENIIGLAVDLRADYETESHISGEKEYTGCVVRKGKIEYFHIESPAALWEILSNKYLLGEGTLMALASASKTAFLEHPIGMDFEMTDSVYEKNQSIFSKVESIASKVTEENWSQYVTTLDEDFSFEENIMSAVSKEIQHTSILIMERQIQAILEMYQMDPKDTYLAISGGYGLNCPTNSYLMSKFQFKGFMAPPCINDGGQSIGIALYMFYRNMKHVNFKLEHAFYGDSFENIDYEIKRLKELDYLQSVQELDLDQIVEDIIEAPLAWFDGRAEIGPRALGHRSLISDPRLLSAKDKLNVIKKRQGWRPVAPIVIAEALDDWFEDAYPSPFMLHTFKIKDEKLEQVKAISHIDQSARVQTITKERKEEEQLYRVIEHFGKRTGVPIICNTSLNDNGEPIINHPMEVLHFALKKNIKIVYINGKRIELKNHEKYTNEFVKEPIINAYMENVEELKKVCNPYGMSRAELAYYYWKDLDKEYDIKNESQMRQVKKITRILLKATNASSIFEIESIIDD